MMPFAHNSTVAKDALARCNLTRLELKTSTSSDGEQSLSIDNAVLGPIPKRILFTMAKSADFLGSVNTNAYYFCYFDLSCFALNVKSKQVPPKARP